MTSLKMYCFSLANSNLEKIKKINYIPVGLGKEIFDNLNTKKRSHFVDEDDHMMKFDQNMRSVISEFIDEIN